jgi:redox-sensitive bicupin YhaK (pirin superfamily)
MTTGVPAERATPAQPRAVVATHSGLPTSDGAGVKLTRVIGTRELPDIDPFLMLDEFGSDEPDAYIAGFPDHPHRGFETVTYLLAGRLRHRDNHGHSGFLTAGGVQWMTAGRGIVHSEMPEQEQGLMRGFQLWINLPAAEKMRPAEYQDITASDQPVVALDGGGKVRVIAGEYREARGPAPRRTTDPLYLDVELPASSQFSTEVAAGKSAFVYVYEGRAEVGTPPIAVHAPRLAVLGTGTDIVVRTGAERARLLVAAAWPLNEPIAKYGPFVMNTPEEIRQALEDFQAGRF